MTSLQTHSIFVMIDSVAKTESEKKGGEVGKKVGVLIIGGFGFHEIQIVGHFLVNLNAETVGTFISVLGNFIFICFKNDTCQKNTKICIKDSSSNTRCNECLKQEQPSQCQMHMKKTTMYFMAA